MALPHSLKRRLLRNLHQVTEYADAALPASTTGSLFTISGGRIAVHGIVGLVGTVIQTQACNTTLIGNPTTGTSHNMGALMNISALAAGSMVSIGGKTALAADGLLAGAYMCSNPVVIRVGTIDLLTSATNTGTIGWTLFWEQLDASAAVVTA